MSLSAQSLNADLIAVMRQMANTPTCEHMAAELTTLEAEMLEAAQARSGKAQGEQRRQAESARQDEERRVREEEARAQEARAQEVRPRKRRVCGALHRARPPARTTTMRRDTLNVIREARATRGWGV